MNVNAMFPKSRASSQQKIKISVFEQYRWFPICKSNHARANDSSRRAKKFQAQRSVRVERPKAFKKGKEKIKLIHIHIPPVKRKSIQQI